MAQNGKSDQVMEALKTIVEAAVGDELKSIRESIELFEADIARQLNTAKENAAKASDELRSELDRRLGETNDTINKEKRVRQDAIADVQSMMKGSASELANKIRESADAAGNSLSSTRETLEREVSSLRSDNDQKIEKLTAQINELKAELELRKAENARLNSVLTNFARIVSGDMSMQATAPVQPATDGAGNSDTSAENKQATAENRQSDKSQKQATPPAADDPFKPAAQAPGPQPAASQKNGTAAKSSAAKPPSASSKGSQHEEGLPASDDFMSHIDEMFRLGNK
ncbi:MAG: hypothetical protein GF344_07210 [Chitinivibrionales bacterium]|nr:hypothetical protein [Chitinivibrionales bacterium]MBD3356699.1 hypothetical protein [Chitinivibrionales bacterium]